MSSWRCGCWTFSSGMKSWEARLLLGTRERGRSSGEANQQELGAGNNRENAEWGEPRVLLEQELERSWVRLRAVDERRRARGRSWRDVGCEFDREEGMMRDCWRRDQENRGAGTLGSSSRAASAGFDVGNGGEGANENERSEAGMFGPAGRGRRSGALGLRDAGEKAGKGNRGDGSAGRGRRAGEADDGIAGERGLPGRELERETGREEAGEAGAFDASTWSSGNEGVLCALAAGNEGGSKSWQARVPRATPPRATPPRATPSMGNSASFFFDIFISNIDNFAN